MKRLASSVLATVLMVSLPWNLVQAQLGGVTDANSVLGTRRTLAQSTDTGTQKYIGVDLLDSAAGRRFKVSREGVTYLELDKEGGWSRPLNIQGRNPVFISVRLWASESTIIRAAGARIGFLPAPNKSAIQIFRNKPSGGSMDWAPLNCQFGAGVFDGRTYCNPSTLTLRIDLQNNVWDLFSGDRLIAANLPHVFDSSRDGRIEIVGGRDGCSIMGVLVSNENPLFEDSNRNAVEDKYEREKRGSLAPETIPPSERLRLLQGAWNARPRISIKSDGSIRVTPNDMNPIAKPNL